jgi:alginate O-acetyltransferase complex protein AlgI
MRRIVFIAGVVFCILPLIYVRLGPGQSVVIVGLTFALLRGIDSLFYTFYTGEKIHIKTYYNFMLFVPTFTAGPVFRYRDFDLATEELLPLTFIDFVVAVKRIIRGLFKAIVIGQILTQAMEYLLELGEYTTPISISLVLCSYFNLYFNLSGYADIAIAIGRLCGFVVPENFKNPWFAASFTQFWRCWHCTVSNWIREHVQVVLHNKKRTKIMAAFTAMCVMTTMAMWHGFSWAYLFLSFIPGGFLAIENLLNLTSPKRKWSVTRVFRCFVVNFLFGINTLLFSTNVRTTGRIALGLLRF